MAREMTMFLQGNGLAHYADSFADHRITLAKLHASIEEFETPEQATHTLRHELFGKLVNFTKSECSRLFHYVRAHFDSRGRQAYFADQ